MKLYQDAAPLADSPGPDISCEQQELAQLVSQAVAELPEPLRVVLVLRHYQGINFEQMARMLGIPASTLKSRFAAALLRLRERLYPLVHHRACPRSSSSPPPKDCWIRWARAKSPMPIFADRRPSTTLVSLTNRPINPSGNREAASDERIACGFALFRFLHRIVCRSGPS